MNVTLGAIFGITCEAKGVPFPYLSWYHNDRHVTNTYDSDRHLTVEVKHYDMAGRISCVAKNGVGDEASAGVVLIVNCKSTSIDFELFTQLKRRLLQSFQKSKFPMQLFTLRPACRLESNALQSHIQLRAFIGFSMAGRLRKRTSSQCRTLIW